MIQSRFRSYFETILGTLGMQYDGDFMEKGALFFSFWVVHERIFFPVLNLDHIIQRDEVLEVYVDGIMAAKDSVSAQRVYTDPRFDPWRNIVVGKANDDRAPGSLPELEIYNITHWAKYYDMMEVSEFYREYLCTICCKSSLKYVAFFFQTVIKLVQRRKMI